MTERKWLRLSIVLQWASFFICMAINFLEMKNLPAELQSYSDMPTPPYDLVIVLLGIVFLCAYGYSSIGVYRLKQKSRKLYLVANVCGFIIAPFFGTVIMGPIASSFGDLQGLLIGLVLGLLYFSPIKESFE